MGSVTAIVSAYYCADWLDRRMLNLMEQHVEITAACQSGSEEEKILLKYPCKIIRTTDVPTIYQAWNIMVDTVKTDYIIIANSDDRLANFATQKMVKVLDENPDVGLVYSDVSVILNPDSEPVAVWQFEGGDLLNGCYVGPAPMYRTSLHKLYGMYPADYHVAGDYFYWLLLQENGVKFHCIHEPLVIFWDRSNTDFPNLEYRERNRQKWEGARIRTYFTRLRNGN